mmetsp:Transcript_752/g.2071  ORF Transcript_752/g.2071 Transcript_752/m.2071 type:complete len:239 (+) Transcript_752:182-898(+)
MPSGRKSCSKRASAASRGSSAACRCMVSVKTTNKCRNVIRFRPPTSLRCSRGSCGSWPRPAKPHVAAKRCKAARVGAVLLTARTFGHITSSINACDSARGMLLKLSRRCLSSCFGGVACGRWQNSHARPCQQSANKCKQGRPQRSGCPRLPGFNLSPSAAAPRLHAAGGAAAPPRVLEAEWATPVLQRTAALRAAAARRAAGCQSHRKSTAPTSRRTLCHGAWHTVCRAGSRCGSLTL